MICKSCNAVNSADKNFCGQCGAKLEAKPVGVPVPGDDGAFYCARHKKTSTRLRCGRCDTPICTRCVVHGPAGVRCRDCARNRVAVRPMGMINEASRQARYTVNGTLARYGVLGIFVVFSLFRFVLGGLGGLLGGNAPRHLPPLPPPILPIIDRNSPPLKPLDWKSFLHNYSRELLTVDVWRELGPPPAEWLKQNYPGAPGASEAGIVAAEQRLGRLLPPSYRAFLRASNGWKDLGGPLSPGSLLPVETVTTLISAHPEWIQGWAANGVNVSPQEHLLRRDDSSVYRGSYLYNAILISEDGDGGFVCLCPDVKTPLGEWECWQVSSGDSSVSRYPSFQAWMISQYGHIHEAYLRGERHSAADVPTQR